MWAPTLLPPCVVFAKQLIIVSLGRISSRSVKTATQHARAPAPGCCHFYLHSTSWVSVEAALTHT